MENTNLFREMNSIPLADDDPQGTLVKTGRPTKSLRLPFNKHKLFR